MFEKLVFAETKFTIKTKHKKQFKARLTKTVFERPNLLRMDVRRAYGCCTLSSKFREYSVSHAQPQSPHSQYLLKPFLFNKIHVNIRKIKVLKYFNNQKPF